MVTCLLYIASTVSTFSLFACRFRIWAPRPAKAPVAAHATSTVQRILHEGMKKCQGPSSGKARTRILSYRGRTLGGGDVVK